MTRFNTQRFRTVIGATLFLAAAGIAGLPAATHAVCVGDCNEDSKVIISEVQRCVNISQSVQTVSACENADQNHDGVVSTEEVNACVASFLDAANCPQVLPTLTPTNTLPPTATNTPLPTDTPTNTPAVTDTPTATATLTETPTSTATATLPPPTPTSTPTDTPPSTSTATPKPTSAVAACGNGEKEGTEECDDGGTCVDGPNFCQTGPKIGTACTPATAETDCGVNDATKKGYACYGAHCTSDADCGAGTCKTFGGDGCANNCTIETDRPFLFSGAVCSGGPTQGKQCTAVGETGTTTLPGDCGYNGTCLGAGECSAGLPGRIGQDCAASNICLGGAAAGRSCSNTNLPEACRACTKGDIGKRCTKNTDCGTGGECPSLQCSAASGANKGKACTADSGCGTGGRCNAMFVCNGGTTPGKTCKADTDCNAGGTDGYCATICGSQCGPTTSSPVCQNKSRALLVSASLPVSIGPMIGHQKITTGKANPDGRIPMVVKSDSVYFEPVRVPTLACACVRGGDDPSIHGPGNSGSGYIGCGAQGLANVNVEIGLDHNTTTTRTCTHGPRAGVACAGDEDCTIRGTCVDLKCNGGPNPGASCTADYECIFFGLCNVQGPGVCSAASGAAAGNLCNEDLDCSGGVCEGLFQGGGLCFGGANNRKRCTKNSDCGEGAVCNSPDDPTCNAADPLPERRNRLACMESKQKCTTAYQVPVGTLCDDDSDCGIGGICGNDCSATSPHPGVCNSPFHFRSYNLPETQVPGAALLMNTTAIGTITSADGGNCSYDPTDPAKGPDGLPCTADDPPSSQGEGQTLPQTTGRASAVVVDSNAFTGSVIIDGQCSGGKDPTCVSGVSGKPFSCEALTSNPTGGTAGGRLATAFPAIETNQVGDNTVVNVISGVAEPAAE